MRYWKAGLIFLIAFLIQPSLLNMINIGGYTPNLLLCLVVMLLYGLMEAQVYHLTSNPAALLLAGAAFAQPPRRWPGVYGAQEET